MRGWLAAANQPRNAAVGSPTVPGDSNRLDKAVARVGEDAPAP
jgi:hypothetical protein